MTPPDDALRIRDEICADLQGGLVRAGLGAVVLDRSPDRAGLQIAVTSRAAAHVRRHLDAMDWTWRTPAPGRRPHERSTWTFSGGVRVTVVNPSRLSGYDDARIAGYALRYLQDHGPGLVDAPGRLAGMYLLVVAGPAALRRNESLRHEIRHALGEHPASDVRGILRGSRQQVTRTAALEVWPDLVAQLRRRPWQTRAWGVVRTLWRQKGAPPVTTCRFDGIELLAGPGTFWPRRQSEALVLAACEALDRLGVQGEARVIDVGTGCGAVALAIARRRPDATVLGVDSEAEPLTWMGRNISAHRLDDRVVPWRSDLLSDVPAGWTCGVHLVVGNIPCVPEAEFLAAADTGPVGYVGTDADGLGLHRTLLEQATSVVVPGGMLCLQSRPAEEPTLLAAARAAGWALGDHRLVGSVAVVTLVREDGEPSGPRGGGSC